VQLLAAAADLRERLVEQGWSIGNSKSQIIPLMVGDADRAMGLAARLRESGYFIPAIRPPSVPEGESLLRLSICYHHTPAIIDALIEAFARLR
jgi:7-keto-8-aminopelargonate synthetase-like enzyme